jgi:DNA-binding GntR family transcriptional regulator
MPGRSKSKAMPRYRELADRLIEGIRDGQFAVGEVLPGEIEMTEKFGVSRHTVREALRVLEDLHLIDRRQGIGTVVRSNKTTSGYVQTVTTPSELMAYPPDARLHVVATAEVSASRSLARLLGCRGGSRWLKVGALRRFKDDRLPISWVDVYLLPEFASIVPSIGKRGGRVYELIQSHFGISVARVAMDIRASLIPHGMQEALRVEAGTPSLTIVRRYVSDAKRLFLVSVSEHPADRYIYSLQLTRGWQSGAHW